MIMTDRILKSKANKLSEINAQLNELVKIADKLKADITDEMEKRSVDELTIGDNIIRWKLITSLRFDSKTFREAHNALYEQYSKQSNTKRFTLANA